MLTAVAVRERPILFSAPMVRAILAGHKTQTRRVVKLPRWFVPPATLGMVPGAILHETVCPYGQPGDRLWVRETWGQVSWTTIIGRPKPPRVETVYRAGPHSFDRDVPHGWTAGNRWRSPIHMPRWASRITLEVTGVRVERVAEITEADAQAEGVAHGNVAGLDVDIDGDVWNGAYRRAFRRLWDSLNTKRGYGWGTNPWVWVMEFRRADGAA